MAYLKVRGELTIDNNDLPLYRTHIVIPKSYAVKSVENTQCTPVQKEMSSLSKHINRWPGLSWDIGDAVYNMRQRLQSKEITSTPNGDPGQSMANSWLRFVPLNGSTYLVIVDYYVLQVSSNKKQFLKT